jgi:hypothetical protein
MHGIGFVNLLTRILPDMVKIDAGGFGVGVLSRAFELVRKTDIFLLEVTICEQNNENSLDKAIQTMTELSYVIDITDFMRSPEFRSTLALRGSIFEKWVSPCRYGHHVCVDGIGAAVGPRRHAIHTGGFVSRRSTPKCRNRRAGMRRYRSPCRAHNSESATHIVRQMQGTFARERRGRICSR